MTDVFHRMVVKPLVCIIVMKIRNPLIRLAAEFAEIMSRSRARGQRQIDRNSRRIKPACHRHRDIMHTRDVFQRPKRRHLRIEAHHLIDVFLCEKLLETAVFCRALKA